MNEMSSLIKSKIMGKIQYVCDGEAREFGVEVELCSAARGGVGL